MTREANGPLLVIAGLCGAAGVALAALASHSGGANTAIAANFLLFHAPAFIGLSLLERNRIATIAGWVLVVGLVLFAGDLLMRERAGMPLFPMAAPLGGGAMILGWIGVAIAGIAAWRR